MLKITLHDSATELRFHLEGRLSGAWVTELRQCWRTAASTTQGRKTILDLHEVDFVDSAGGSLLAEMHGAGVQIQAITPLIQSVVEEACHTRHCGTVEEKPGSSDALLRADTSGPARQAPYRTKSRAS